MFIANRAARKAKWFSRGLKNIDPRIADDAAQDVLVLFFSMEDYARPQTEQEFEVFAYEQARRMLQKENVIARREKAVGDFKKPNMKRVHEIDDDYIFDRIYAVGHRVYPQQENILYFLDILRYLDKLPGNYKNAVLRLAKSETIVGFSQDYNISLFDAMAEQRRLRAIVRRIAEDVADDKLEADSRADGDSA